MRACRSWSSAANYRNLPRPPPPQVDRRCKFTRVAVVVLPQQHDTALTALATNTTGSANGRRGAGGTGGVTAALPAARQAQAGSASAPPRFVLGLTHHKTGTLVMLMLPLVLV